MKLLLLTIPVLALVFVSCKKKEDKEPEFDGAAPGKIKSVGNGQWDFRYNEDGLLVEYDYIENGLNKTGTIEWTPDEVTCNNGLGFQYVYPRNAAGYALPGSGSSNWSYDANNQVVYLNGSNYFWSNGNIDSLVFGSAVYIYSYTSDLDKRDYGAHFIPTLIGFPVDNLRVKNLAASLTLLNANRDTVSYRTFTYELDAEGRVLKEMVYENISGNPQYIGQRSYSYY